MEKDIFGMAMQGLVDNMCAQERAERAKTQMTLGALIAALEAMPPNRRVRGFGRPMSYRGYYSDLAFEPSGDTTSAAELLAVARSCMGRVFEGYKGGDFMMGETTPVWIAGYGQGFCPRLMGLTDGDPVEPVLAMEEE